MKDTSGDGILGGNSGGHYHLTKRNETSFILIRILWRMLIGVIVAIVIFTILAMLNNRFSINLIQDVIAGTR